MPTTAGTGSEATRFTIITDEATDEKMLCPGLAYLPVAALVDYELTFTVRGDELTLALGGKRLLTAKDDAFGWGMAGYAMYGSGRAELNDITVKEL